MESKTEGAYPPRKLAPEVSQSCLLSPLQGLHRQYFPDGSLKLPEWIAVVGAWLCLQAMVVPDLHFLRQLSIVGVIFGVVLCAVVIGVSAHDGERERARISLQSIIGPLKLCTHVCGHVCVHVYLCKHMYVYMYVHTCVHVRVYICFKI